MATFLIQFGKPQFFYCRNAQNQNVNFISSNKLVFISHENIENTFKYDIININNYLLIVLVGKVIMQNFYLALKL